MSHTGVFINIPCILVDSKLHISIIYMPVHVNTIIPYHTFSLYMCVCVCLYVYIHMHLYDCVHMIMDYMVVIKCNMRSNMGIKKGFLFIIILYFIIHHPGKSD